MIETEIEIIEAVVVLAEALIAVVEVIGTSHEVEKDHDLESEIIVQIGIMKIEMVVVAMIQTDTETKIDTLEAVEIETAIETENVIAIEEVNIADIEERTWRTDFRTIVSSAPTFVM